MNKKPHLISIKVNISGFESDEITFKPMSFDDLLISFDRLTRFKYPLYKKNRVYTEIITKHLCSPVINLKNIHSLQQGIIESLVGLIWDYSVKFLNPKEDKNKNLLLNFYLAYEDVKVFSAYSLVKDSLFSERITKSNKSQILSENDLPFEFSTKILNELIEIYNQNGFSLNLQDNILKEFKGYESFYILFCIDKSLNILGLIELLEHKEFELPLNLRRLVQINRFIQENNLNLTSESLKKIEAFAVQSNFLNSYGFPVKLLIITEGATEETLLPVFSDKQGLNFKQNGIQLIGAGGKNQVARIYFEYRQKYNIPILIILDADADCIAQNINRVINDKDKLYLINNGEFEDILPINLICRSINKFYKMTGSVTQDEITETDNCMSSTLNELWKEKGFGEFKKAEFAKIIAENVKSKRDISFEIQQIIEIAKKLVARDL